MELLLTALMLALTVVAGPVASGAFAAAPNRNGRDKRFSSKCLDGDHQHRVNNKDRGFTSNPSGQ